MHKHMTENEIREWIYTMTDYEIVQIWNEYCYKQRYYDDVIYDFSNPESFFNEWYEGRDLEPWEIIKDINGSDIDMSCGYIKDTIYGFETTNDPRTWMDVKALLNDIIEYPESYDICLMEDDE